MNSSSLIFSRLRKILNTTRQSINNQLKNHGQDIKRDKRAGGWTGDESYGRQTSSTMTLTKPNLTNTEKGEF